MNDKKRVLILCTGNSARSQMGEGLLRQDGGEHFEVESAGVEPSHVRPQAIEVMREIGIDISRHRSKSVDEFSGQEFDYVITVCDNANGRCPVFPGKTTRIHWSFEDPAAAAGDESARLAVFRHVRDEIRGALERPSRELRGMGWQQATGTSGTILAIGETLQQRKLRDVLQQLQGVQPAGAEIVLSQLERFNERAAEMSVAERRNVPGISAQRAEILIAGGQILEGAMRALGINLLRTCNWALREGVIVDRLRELEAEALPPVPDEADQRLRGVHAVGRRFGYEETHARQVARFAERIFDILSPIYNLTRHQRTLLSAAALLHDVGYHIAHESHHKHALYLVKHSELTGFSEAERNVIANIARYHRGATPKERHPDYAALNQSDRETVCRLAAILRVADALDRSHDNRVREIRCTCDGQSIHIQLRSALNCDKEIYAAEQKSDLFEQAFNCKPGFSRRAIARRA